MAAAPLKAIPTRDRQRIVLAAGTWRTTIPAADLPRWIRLYRRLRDRGARLDPKGNPIEPGPYARFYAADLAVLEATAARLREAAT
jgi:hypothetical protein